MAARRSTRNQALFRSCLSGALGALAAALPAQSEPRSEPISLTADDGTRFVLAPDPSPDAAGIVHWVVLAPAGADHDPPGLEGMSYAVARASLSGTETIGSRSPADELAALEQLDALERRAGELEALRQPLDPILADLTAARAEADRLADPTAWQRALRAAPALAVELSETPEATLLELTTIPSAIPTIARLLYDRREANRLRGVREHFRQVRRELLDRQTEPDWMPRRELLGMAFLGHAASRPVEPQASPWGRVDALSVHAATSHPTRVLHVLLGGFDVEEVERALREVFRSTALPLRPAPRAAAPRAGQHRQSTIHGSGRDAVAIGFHLNERTPARVVDAVAEWLAGGRESFLAERLHLEGLTDAVVTTQAPFPGNALPGLLLVEVHVPDVGGAPSPPLWPAVERALNGARTSVPSTEDMDRVVARLAGRHAVELASPSARARRLAIACGVRGASPADALSAPTVPDRDLVHATMRDLLEHATRTVVVLEKRP